MLGRKLTGDLFIAGANTEGEPSLQPLVSQRRALPDRARVALAEKTPRFCILVWIPTHFVIDYQDSTFRRV